MSKKINEAQVKLDILDLQSSDLATLARMMELAGQAQEGSDVGNAMGVPGSIAGAVGSIGGSELPSEEEVGFDMNGEPDVGSSMEVGAEPSIDPLQGAIDSLGGATDFGAEDSVPEIPEMMESEDSEDQDDLIEEELKRMSKLSGIVTEDEDEDDLADIDEDDLEESRIIPDLSLEEDTEGNNSTEFGPFKSEQDAIRDAKWKTNGELGDTFTVEPKEDGFFYWCRVMEEQAFSTEAEPEFVDTDGIQYATHLMKPKFNGAALGDNPLREDDESEDDESVDDIFESLQKKYNEFLGGK